MNLLSSVGTRSLNNFYNGVNSKGQSNLSILQGISTYNSYTGQNHGFNMSIFNNDSGLSGSSSFGSSSFNGGMSFNRTSIPTSISQYSNGKYGASLMGNFMDSITHIALGQEAPVSVFEQRLNWATGGAYQIGGGSMKGDYSNYFNTDSVANNKNNTTAYNVFNTEDVKSATSANSVSELMAALKTGGTNATNNSLIKQAAGTKTVSGLMSALSVMA